MPRPTSWAADPDSPAGEQPSSRSVSQASSELAREIWGWPAVFWRSSFGHQRSARVIVFHFDEPSFCPPLVTESSTSAAWAQLNFQGFLRMIYAGRLATGSACGARRRPERAARERDIN